MVKDWTGNNKAVYTCLGASNHVLEERQVEDYYATDPKAAELLLEVEPNLHDIWECAVGEKHLANVFEKVGKLARMSDIINRTDDNRIEVIDFLQINSGGLLQKKEPLYQGSIVTNPPYVKSKEFVEQALSLVVEGEKVCMFLKVTFLEGKARKEFFKQSPPKIIYVCSGRIPCAKNGDFEKYPSSAIAYAWFVWEKGYKGKTVIDWIN